MPRFFAALLFLISLPLFAASAAGVPILAYHQVAADPQSGWAMRSNDFREQMELLAACGYHVIPIEELVDFIDGRRDALPPHPVVISDDDGWRSTYTDMDPILRQFGYPYSIYVYTAIIGKGADYMTWPQVVELARRGVDVECHTVTHPHLIHRSHPDMSDAAYAAWLHQELTASKAILEKATGHSVTVLSYPYGDFDAAIIAEAKRDGYRAALTSWRGLNVRTTNPLALFRTDMESDITIGQFLAGLGTEPLPLEQQSPAPAAVVATERQISAVLGTRTIDPTSVHMIVLGDSSDHSVYDAGDGKVTLTLNAPLPNVPHTVVVWADTPDGQRLATSWIFYPSQQEKERQAAIRKKLLDLPLHHTETHREP